MSDIHTHVSLRLLVDVLQHGAAILQGERWLDRQLIESGYLSTEEWEQDWADHIEVSRLEMASPCRCVLGQIADLDPAADHYVGGGYYAVIGGRSPVLQPDPIDQADNQVWATTHGFDSRKIDRTDYSSYTLLQAGWEQLIDDRRHDTRDRGVHLVDGGVA